MNFKIAFAKGRGASECIRLFEQNDIIIPQAFYDNKIVFHTIPEFQIDCHTVRGSDVGWLLERGYVDAAFGSSIIFEEYESPNLTCIMPLEIGQCRLSLITRDDSKTTIRKICTRYPQTVSRRLGNRRANLEIIKLSGCLENALLLGISDAIVDIVDTGGSLKAHSLYEREVVHQIQHGCWIRSDQIGRLDSSLFTKR